MKRVIVVIMIMITVLAVSAQDTVVNVIPSYAKPYFLGNVRIKDSLETKLMFIDDTLFFGDGTSMSSSVSIDFINVEDYGAVGDGITDNTVAINSAITAAAASGKSIYIPTGTFNISGVLRVTTNNINIFGVGMNKSTIHLTSNHFGFLINAATNVNFKDIGFTGTSSGSDQDPIYYYNGSNGSVVSCSFLNIGGSSVMNFGGGYIHVSGCVFTSCNIGVNNPGEYSVLSNNVLRYCNYGFIVKHGNQNIVGNSMFTCSTGIKILTTSNDGHDVITGCNINHSTYSFDIDSISNGVVVSACYSWSSGIILRKSKGVIFNSTSFDSGTMYLDGSYSEMNDCQYRSSFTIINDYNGHKSYNRISNLNAISDTLGYYNIKSDHSADTSFVVESEMGKKFVLMDAGDMILDDLHFNADSATVADEASIVFADGISGWGEVYVFDAGAIAEWAEFIFSSDGTVYLKSNSATIVTTDTDTKFCIFDNGSGVTIRNRLGGSRNVKYVIHH